TSWLQAPVLSIAPRLRQYGSTRRRGGKPTTIIDRSVQKRHLAMIAQEEARQLAIARRRLAMEEPMLLSDLHVLDPVEFNLFFDLLTRALAGKRKFNDTIETSSTDGTMEIKLEPVPDADWIEVQTTMGTLTARQHRIFVRDIFPVVTAEGAGVEEPA
ncbi:MAG: DUF2397 family protein, partial [Acidobacteriota bacterium]|nr:DUF2397 family protein [Acidobacteriota bacterium]